MNKQFKWAMLVRAAWILLAVGALSGLWATDMGIGTAVANGSFQIDHSRVFGNATVFDGSVVETRSVPSEVKLNGGARMRLATDTRATIYQGRLLLEAGYGQVESAPGYEVEARSLRILAAVPDTMARIRLNAGRTVTVSAVRGGVLVRNEAGLLVASVGTGRSLDFEPQEAGAAAPTRATGCLLEKSGKLLLAEQTTNIVLEVRGEGLKGELGNRVEVTGMPEKAQSPAPEASQVIQVAGVKRVSKGGCRSQAAYLGASAGATAAAGAAVSGTTAGAVGAAAGAATATGITAGTVAVIGGVAAAATVGGLAATHSLPGQSESVPSVSR